MSPQGEVVVKAQAHWHERQHHLLLDFDLGCDGHIYSQQHTLQSPGKLEFWAGARWSPLILGGLSLGASNNVGMY